MQGLSREVRLAGRGDGMLGRKEEEEKGGGRFEDEDGVGGKREGGEGDKEGNEGV